MILRSKRVRRATRLAPASVYSITSRYANLSIVLVAGACTGVTAGPNPWNEITAEITFLRELLKRQPPKGMGWFRYPPYQLASPAHPAGSPSDDHLEVVGPSSFKLRRKSRNDISWLILAHASIGYYGTHRLQQCRAVCMM
jgi:hypothetical protein